MAFTFADGEVNHGSDASLDNLGATPLGVTVMALVRPTTSDGTTRKIVSKRNDSTNRWQLSVGDRSGVERLYFDRGTTGTFAQSESASSTIVLNAWQWVAATHIHANPAKLYRAGIGEALTECAYAVQTTPTGTSGNDATGNLFVGRVSATVEAFLGQVQLVIVCNRTFDLATLRRQTEQPWAPIDAIRGSCVLFAVYGISGGPSELQIDRSGRNNHGIVSGTVTRADPAPYPGLWTPRPVFWQAITVPPITGAAAVIVAKPTMAASGAEVFAGTGGVTIGEPAFAATGAWVFGTPIFTFTVAARTRALEAVER